MILKHYFLEKIAHSSYLLAGRSACAVVDPRRDVEFYVREARALGVTITHVLETHLHADFLSGSQELAAAVGATIHAPRAAACAFAHVGLAEGDVVTLEDMTLRVVETPGHTPEHIVYVVTDHSRGETPVGVFVGDVLFVGDVGRPDLFPDKSRQLAGQLYDSLHEKLLRLPDHVEVYPAHGAGSLCGRSMGAKWLSTIGYERRCNPALAIADREAFIRSLTSDMPAAPDHFGRLSDVNRQGARLFSELPPLDELRLEGFCERLDAGGAVVLDVRAYAAFASLHVPGSWHLDLNGNFPTFAGWVLPPDQDILLVADSFDDASAARTWAARVGVDRIVGYLHGGMVSWATAGRKIEDIAMLSAEVLHDMVTGTDNLVLVDVRGQLEFADSHIEGAINIPGPDVRVRYAELDPLKPTILICSTGNRSSMAGSLLKQRGFRAVYNVAGGMTGYSAAGYARECRVCENPHGSRYAAAAYGR